jgi:hypothetical protein
MTVNGHNAEGGDCVPQVVHAHGKLVEDVFVMAFQIAVSGIVPTMPEQSTEYRLVQNRILFC